MLFRYLGVDVVFFNDTATTQIYTLSLHDALPISGRQLLHARGALAAGRPAPRPAAGGVRGGARAAHPLDRKSTRLNSSHANISYAVFCLKKKSSLTSSTPKP